jgi:hypothetical protein
VSEAARAPPSGWWNRLAGAGGVSKESPKMEYEKKGLGSNNGGWVVGKSIDTWASGKEPHG